VRVSLNERGELDTIFVSGPSLLAYDEAAIEAVKKWRFAAFTDAGGSPQMVTGEVIVVFNVPQRAW